MDVPLGVAGFLVAFAGTAMMLLEGREHLFFPDFGVGTPLGLWELISKSLIFSVGYILLGIAIVRPASCGVAPAPAHHRRTRSRLLVTHRDPAGAPRRPRAVTAPASRGWGKHPGTARSTSNRRWALERWR
jgi:hypothetical protein